MAAPLLEALPRLNTKLTVGDNLPYAGTQVAYSLNLHAGLTGLRQWCRNGKMGRIAGRFPF